MDHYIAHENNFKNLSSAQSLTRVRLFSIHGLQYARLPCPSPIPGAYSNSCPSCQWCHPTISSSVILLLLPPSVFPSIRLFSNELLLHIRWPKYWSFSFSMRPSNEYSGLISFRMDWLDLFAVQETFKSLLQHYSSKALILQCSAFFIVQPSQPYMTTGKTIALTQIRSDQSLSHVRLFATPWTTAHQASLSFTLPQSLLKPMSIKLVMPSNHLILCHPLLLLPSIFPSIRVFSNELALHIRWPKYWSFSFSISPSNE